MKYFKFILLVIISTTIYLSRFIFNYQFDSNYLQDYFDHSQWRIPQSSRVISDNELYQISSFYILKTGNLFVINPETPPLIKYFYAISIYLFNNPYYVSLFFYLITILIYSLLIKESIKQKINRHYVVLLFILSPIFFSNLHQTMMDLPQLFFFILHIYLVTMLIKKQSHLKLQYLLAILSGLTIACFSNIKFPVFLPLIFLIDILMLLKFKNKYQLIFIFISTFIISFLLIYLPFFYQQLDLIAFIKVQKWIFHFYQNSTHENTFPLMVIISSLSGFYQMLFNHSWIQIKEWSIIWPAISITYFIYLFKYIFKNRFQLKKNHDQYLFLIFSSLLLILIVIPFWPRYYLILLPIGLIYLIKTLNKYRILIDIILFVSIIQAYLYLKPNLTETHNFISLFWEKSQYLELYNFLDKESKSRITRIDFANQLTLIDQENSLTQKKILIDNNYVYPWENSNKNQLVIIDSAQSNKIIKTYNIIFIREDNEWKFRLIN